MKLFKNKIFLILIFIIFLVVLFFILSSDTSKKNDNNIEDDSNIVEEPSFESSIDSIEIVDVDGKDTNYEFIYHDEVFKVYYVYDNWKIYDSYKIKNQADMKIICQALIDIHPIHGRDRISYRTADDMVYEWVQHNIAYEILPEDSKWRNNAKNVDFDPDDQGKSLKEMFDERTNNNENKN